MQTQSNLFEISEDSSNRESAGKNLIRKLSQIRRGLSSSEKEFDFYLASLVREIKRVSTLTDEEREDLVLFCVEESHAHTVQEIAEDSHLPEAVVKDLLGNLIDKKLIEMRQRFTVGGSANQTLIFSKRKPCSCV